MVTDTGQIFDSSTSYQNNRMLLQVVALARNISDHFVAIRQSDLGDFPERRVWFLRCPRHYLNANAASLRAVSQCWRLRLDPHLSTTFSDKLVNCWHSLKNSVSPLLSGLKKPPWYDHQTRGSVDYIIFPTPRKSFLGDLPYETPRTECEFSRKLCTCQVVSLEAPRLQGLVAAKCNHSAELRIRWTQSSDRSLPTASRRGQCSLPNCFLYWPAGSANLGGKGRVSGALIARFWHSLLGGALYALSPTE